MKYYIPLMNYLSPVASGGASQAPVSAEGSGGTGTVGAEEASPHWHIGVSGGYANNALHTSTGGRALTEYENGHGFEVAIPVRRQVNSWFAVQAELQYIQKNYTWQRTGQYDRVHSTVTNRFIEIPLMANFSVGGEKLRIFANAGGYVGAWIDSRRKGIQIENTSNPFEAGSVYYDDYDERVEFDKRRDAPFEAGLLGGVGLQYAFKSCVLFLEGRYYYGLTDLQQNYGYNMVPRMNDTVTIAMGVLFNHNLIKSFGRRK
jgi:hypothetical protein